VADAQANKAALKKLFNLLSLRLHPDKNPGDPLAKDAFQHLSAAHDALRALLQLA
jgi:curved DNA-binding protein CbpA